MLSARISYGCHFSKRALMLLFHISEGWIEVLEIQIPNQHCLIWQSERDWGGNSLTYAPLPPGSFVQKCETSSAAAKAAAAALKCFCKEEGGRERFSYPPHFPLKNLRWMAVWQTTPSRIFAEKRLKFLDSVKNYKYHSQAKVTELVFIVFYKLSKLMQMCLLF